jgi:hypothetical protein
MMVFAEAATRSFEPMMLLLRDICQNQTYARNIPMVFPGAGDA